MHNRSKSERNSRNGHHQNGQGGGVLAIPGQVPIDFKVYPSTLAQSTSASYGTADGVMHVAIAAGLSKLEHAAIAMAAAGVQTLHEPLTPMQAVERAAEVLAACQQFAAQRQAAAQAEVEQRAAEEAAAGEGDGEPPLDNQEPAGGSGEGSPIILP